MGLCWGEGEVGALKVALEAILPSRGFKPKVGKRLPLLCKKILNWKTQECSRLGSAADLRLRP